MSLKRGYEVYECYLDGELIYIGQGRLGRHKHCNSGRSHVVNLNKLHFEGKVFDVKVKIYKTKKEALQVELEKIKRHNPKFNVVHTDRDARQVKGLKVAKLVLRFKSVVKYTHHIYDQVELKKWSDAFTEFLRHHELTDKTLQHLPLHERCFYKTKTSPNMFGIYRSYMDTPHTRGKGWKFFDCVIMVLNENGYNFSHNDDRKHK